MILHPNVKLNLGLSVIRRRPDGFHELETLFIPYFGITDTLEIVPTPSAADVSIEIQKEGGVDWDPMSDLTVRAWRALKADFPQVQPVHIRLEKHAPVGAGLGGGSSDAAFTLRALNGLFSLGLDDAALASYAATLGSDCAFFVYDRPMMGRGRGEILEPFDLDLEGWELRVAIPAGVAVSTREAYAGIRTREVLGTLGLEPLESILRRPLNEWKGRLVNDFESTVFPLHPEIPALKQRLYDDGAVYAAMSGSGSAVFGLFRKQ